MMSIHEQKSRHLKVYRKKCSVYADYKSFKAIKYAKRCKKNEMKQDTLRLVEVAI